MLIKVLLLATIVGTFTTNIALANDEMHRLLFQPLPEVKIDHNNPTEVAKIKLGKKLFLEPKLSSNQTISCNSCHTLDKFGVDNIPVSPGTAGEFGNRNSPTVYNAALHIAQFWDGRAKDVEEQALGPIMNPVEMSMPSEEVVIKRLKEDVEYQKLFSSAFPTDSQPLSFKNIGVAIGAFERTLITPSRFDEYLKGDSKALTEEEKAGLNKFIEVGCTTCHNGVLLGGNAFHKLGLVKEYPTKNTSDLGRYEVTKKEHDKMVFKVPSLRNIAETAPYFHDGSIATLEDSIKTMAEYQLGKELSQSEIQTIASFLKSLTGELPKDI